MTNESAELALLIAGNNDLQSQMMATEAHDKILDGQWMAIGWLLRGRPPLPGRSNHEPSQEHATRIYIKRSSCARRSNDSIKVGLSRLIGCRNVVNNVLVQCQCSCLSTASPKSWL